MCGRERGEVCVWEGENVYVGGGGEKCVCGRGRGEVCVWEGEGRSVCVGGGQCHIKHEMQ